LLLNAGILIVSAVEENHDGEFQQTVSFLQDIPEEKFCLRGGATAGGQELELTSLISRAELSICPGH